MVRESNVFCWKHFFVRIFFSLKFVRNASGKCTFIFYSFLSVNFYRSERILVADFVQGYISTRKGWRWSKMLEGTEHSPERIKIRHSRSFFFVRLCVTNSNCLASALCMTEENCKRVHSKKLPGCIGCCKLADLNKLFLNFTVNYHRKL